LLVFFAVILEGITAVADTQDKKHKYYSVYNSFHGSLSF